jgi:chromosome partitioning protein
MKNLLKESLKKFVDRGDERERGSKNAKVLAVAAQKGGVGKTTTVVNLAAALAEDHGWKTLIIDLDPQGHVERSLQELVTRRGGRISSILESEDEDREVMDAVSRTKVPNLDITTGDSRLRETENLLTTRMGKEFVLQEAIEVTKTWYDLILIDCPPNLGNLTINGLTAASHVLIPCDPKPLAVQGVDALIRTCATVSDRLNPDIDILGVVVTRYDGRNSKMNKKVLADLEENYGDAIFKSRIGVNTALSKAQDAGTTIFAFDAKSRGADDYRKLANEVIERLQYD